MYKLAAILLTLIIISCGSFSVSASTPSITLLHEYEKTLAEEAASKAQPRSIDGVELHQLVSGSSSNIELSDGTVWDVGLFWTASNWQGGDVIRISYEYGFYYTIKIENLSQNQTVWSSIMSPTPDPTKQDTRKIIRLENNSLTLDDGTHFKMISQFDPAGEESFKVGDPIFVMSYSAYHYLLFNGKYVNSYPSPYGGPTPAYRHWIVDKI